MTTANFDFQDLMPHRIEITGAGTELDDYGQTVNVGEKRVYICLLDDKVNENRNADGTTVSYQLVAYVAPIPIGMNKVVDISESEKAKIIVPYEKVVMIDGIERHYDSENGIGALHNIVLHLGGGVERGY